MSLLKLFILRLEGLRWVGLAGIDVLRMSGLWNRDLEFGAKITGGSANTTAMSASLTALIFAWACEQSGVVTVKERNEVGADKGSATKGIILVGGVR